jgi:6,7-dimethyl-8-ribityllumazine synthase
MIEYRGSHDGRGLRIGIAVSRFNELVTDRLLAAALDGLRSAGVDEKDIVVAHVPGAFELPLAARALVERARVDAVVALGSIVRGETAHFEIVAGESAAGVREVALASGVPVLNAILTTESMAQALDRAGGKSGNRGRDAALGAVEMARLMRSIAETGREAAR